MKLENRTGREPLAHAVLLIPYVKDFHHKASTIVLPDSYEAAVKSIETRFIVLDIGPEAWSAPGQTRRCEVGDKIMISKFAGSQVIGEDNMIYRMVNANDIYCRITDEVEIEDYLKTTGYYHE